MEKSERWVSVEEITEHLGVSSDTVYRWISEKEMPCARVGRRWKFKVSEVDSWARSGKAADQDEGTEGSEEDSPRKGGAR
ncbi:helix-turn-helix domain-containing protein [bacterium]|nr:helix-turn-helix domain-containing protein [bacterium]